MWLSDDEFAAFIADVDPREIPADISETELRQHIENLVDLVELLMQPLPLPPAHTAGLTRYTL